MKVRPVEKRSSTLHDFPYSGERRKCIHTWIINVTPPGYDHCVHRCVYCYARDAIFSRKPGGSLEVYANLAEVVERDLRSIKLCPPISISNTTDPLQDVPEVWRVTRGVLELILKRGPSFCIVTKGRADKLLEVEGFAPFPRKFVAVTIEGTAEILRLLSPRAPSFEERLEGVARLAEAGVLCSIRLDPFFPHLFRAIYGGAWKAKLGKLLETFAQAGARHITCSTGRLSRQRAFGRPSSLEHISRIIGRYSAEEKENFLRDYIFDRSETSSGYLLQRQKRLGLHRWLRSTTEGFGMTYSTCQETSKEETDSQSIATCEGFPLPFTRKVEERFDPVPGCDGNCFGRCSRLPLVPCGRPELTRKEPFKKSYLT